MADVKEKNVDKYNVDNVTEHSSMLTFDERVIKKIIGISVNEVPGIIAMSGNFITGLTDKLKSADDPTKGINVELGRKQVAVSMKVICEYGRSIPIIFQDIIDKITTSMKEMTGLDVVDVKVHVYDVLTKEDFERQNKKRIEEKADGTEESLLE